VNKPYLQVVTEDRRLALLRLLAEASEYRANDSVLTKALYALGHDAARAQVLADLHWLAQVGLVDLDDAFRPVTVAVLTQHGGDVAAGRASVPGVARPTPGT